MSQFLDRLPSGLRFSAPVIVSAVALGATTYVVVMGLKSVGSAVISSSVDEASADPLAILATESEAFIETSRRRFEGRSMYTLPPQPVRKARIVDTPKPIEPPKDPGPPPAPATYTGPAPTSIFADYVTFTTLGEDDKRIKVGQTVAGITVIEVNAPYNAKLGYQRGEYIVTLWPRIDERFLRGGMPASKVSGMVEAGASGAKATLAGTAASGPGAMVAPATAAGAGGAAAGAAIAGPSLAPPRRGNANPGAGGANPGANPGATPGANPPGSPGSPTGVPGMGPGEVPTTVPGPGGELPSPAMDPQEIPPPSPPSQEGEEFVDRAQLPQPLTDDRISAMSVPEAERAIRAIAGTDGWNVDDHSRARLDHERNQLQARVNRGG
jgi:hypothetical protein